MIEKALWLPDGFSYSRPLSQGFRVFELRQVTKQNPKKVIIQINTDLLTGKNIRFYQGKTRRGLTLQDVKALKASLTRRWKELHDPSETTLFKKAREVIARRVSHSERRSLRLPPHIFPTEGEKFRAASIERKIQLLRDKMIIPLLENCEHLTKNENQDVYLQLLTQISGFHYEKGLSQPAGFQKAHFEKALHYAKSATTLGEKLGDPYATELGKVMIEELKKKLTDEAQTSGS